MRRMVTLAAIAGATVLAIYVYALGIYPAPVGDVVLYSVKAHAIYSTGQFARLVMPGPALHHLHDVYPPVIPFLMAVFYRLFGFGLLQSLGAAFFSSLGTCLALFSICRRLTDRRSAAAATLLFALSGAVTFAWLAGRYEPTLCLLYALVVLLILKASRPGDATSGWTAGLLAGLLGWAYYPFLAPFLLTFFVCFRNFTWQGDGGRHTRRFLAQFLAGLSVVLAGLTAYLAAHWEFVGKQLFANEARYFPRSAVEAFQCIRNEPARYGLWAAQHLDAGHAALSLATLFLLARKPRGKSWENTVLWCVGIWVVFLAFYGHKHPMYLSYAILWASVGAALAWHRLSQEPAPAFRRLYALLLALAVALGLFRWGLIGFTAAFQREARGYGPVRQSIREWIPAGARVVAPQAAWYALAEHAGALYVYTQGGTEDVVSPPSTSWLSDPRYLDRMSHIILQDEEVLAERFPVMTQYVRERFRLAHRLDLPFKPLPWTKVSPYRMNVYVRSPRNEEAPGP